MDSNNDSVSHDLFCLLSSEERDFLIRNDGDQVKISDLVGKIVGLYFSGTWCGPCRRFTPSLVEAYEELSSKGDFEVVFISSDRIDEAFDVYFAKMPWLAIPFSDSDTRKRLKELFEVKGIPYLVILDGTGKVSCDEGFRIVLDFGAEGYPFTPERVGVLREKAEAAKKEQSLRSLLVSSSPDFLISNNGTKVLGSELVGKNVLLYFSAQWCRPCRDFLPKFIAIYDEIKAKDDAVEVIFISSDRNKSSFDNFFSGMPWLALPFGDERKGFLQRSSNITRIPAVVAIGASGGTVTTQARQLLQAHGADAYPFTEEHLKQLEEQKAEMAMAEVTCEGDECHKA